MHTDASVPMTANRAPRAVRVEGRLTAEPQDLRYCDALEIFKRQYWEQMLAGCGWSFSECARVRKVSRQWLHREAKRLGVQRPKPLDA